MWTYSHRAMVWPSRVDGLQFAKRPPLRGLILPRKDDSMSGCPDSRVLPFPESRAL